MVDKKKNTTVAPKVEKDAGAKATETPNTETPPVAEKKVEKKKVEEKKGEEMVSVEKSVLEQVLANQKEQDTKIARQDKELVRLNAVADKSRLSWYDTQHSDQKLIHTFRVGVWTTRDKEGNATNSYVLGWKIIADEVWFEDKVLKEKQIFKLYLDDGDGNKPVEVEINIMQFTRDLKRVEGALVKDSQTDEGIFKTLQFEDGREIEFDVRFLNP